MTYKLYGFFERSEVHQGPDELSIRNGRTSLVVRNDKVRFVDRSTCVWPNCSPRVAEVPKPIDLFVEGDGGCQYFGEAMVAVYGQKHSNAAPEAQLHLYSRLPQQRWLELQKPSREVGQAPATAIATLTPRSTIEERAAALRSFVRLWFGEGQDSDSSTMPPMPSPLALLHNIVRANSGVVTVNELVQADRLTEVEGRTIFYVENQAACEWAFQAGDSDPTVWFRINEPGETWKREFERMSGFVIQLVLFEAINGEAAPFGGAASALSRSSAQRLQSRFQPLPIGPWCYGQTSFHAQNGALLAVTENGDDTFTAVVAALRPEPLAPIADLVTDAWDVVAF